MRTDDSTGCKSAKQHCGQPAPPSSHRVESGREREGPENTQEENQEAMEKLRLDADRSRERAPR
jgi:hypothetical protein